jgi:hypothetical protein
MYGDADALDVDTLSALAFRLGCIVYLKPEPVGPDAFGLTPVRTVKSRAA